jgi:3-oxoadipate CoA-transferase alpha subunit
LHAVDVGLPVGRPAGTLALPEHPAQTLHGFVVGLVQRVAPRGQQFHRLADAVGLVDRALLADPMINKIADSVAQALAGVKDGATVLIGGFGTAGIPDELIDGLIAHGARDLTIVNNNAGNAEQGVAALLKAGQVRKIICSFPRQADSYVFDELYRSGKLELELVPQGNLAERIRAAGAGIGAFFCPTAYGTELAAGKETREINGKHYVLEYPIYGDVALIKAEKGDRWGNLTYRMSARNFGPVMATAAKTTVATVHEVVELGALDPEAIVTPGVYVSHVVKIARVATQAGGMKKSA